MDKKRRYISKSERAIIAAKTNNRCGYCGIKLKKRFHIDHIVPFCKDGSSCNIENLLAACPTCNRFKSSMTLNQFRNELSRQVERAEKYSVNFRMARKFGLISVKRKAKIKFYFETNMD